MKLSLIAAVSSNNVIGLNNQLPWDLPEDLNNFKKLTVGKPILMGRKTFDSLGRVLPGRVNIVITRNINYKPKGCRVFLDIDEALQEFSHSNEIMVIGGASFYEQLIPQAQMLYMTVIDKYFEGDTFFPLYDVSEWNECSRQDFKQKTEPYLDYSFRIYERRKAKLVL